MTAPAEIIEEIDRRIGEAVTLTVGRMDDGAIETRRLNLASDAADGLREQCRAARDKINDGTPVSYTANADLAEAEYFVIDDAATLSELDTFRDLARDIGAIATITPAGLDLAIKLYAVAVGDTEERLLFVRRTNPRVAHSAGKFLAIGKNG